MNRSQLLNKVAKGVSITLLAGCMVCGTSLINHASANNNSTANYEEKGIREGKYNRNQLGATRQLIRPTRHVVRKRAPKKSARRVYVNHYRNPRVRANKRTRKPVRKSRRIVKVNRRKVNKRNYRIRKDRRNTKRTRKNINRNRNRRRNILSRRTKQSIRRGRARKVARHAYKPMNHRRYRHAQRKTSVKDFRYTKLYRNYWSRAKKENQAKLGLDYRALRIDQNRLSKQTTRYGRLYFKGYIRNIRGHIANLNWYVRHDARMLDLAR